MKFIDIVGMRFGKLQVLGRAESNNKKVRWSCICDCGNLTDIESYLLRKELTRSCGCLVVEHMKKMVSNREGIMLIPGYRSWATMISRCYNPNDTSYSYYGGRGITVCTRWKENFKNFIDDMGERPSQDHSIDRKDTDGNYYPDNCKWSTQLEQIRNRRPSKNNTSGTNGVNFNKIKNVWHSTIYVDGKRKFLGNFKNVDAAILARKEAEQKFWKESS